MTEIKLELKKLKDEGKGLFEDGLIHNSYKGIYTSKEFGGIKVEIKLAMDNPEEIPKKAKFELEGW